MASAIPGRAFPAAHPQTELTTIMSVPDLFVTAPSTSAAVHTLRSEGSRVPPRRPVPKRRLRAPPPEPPRTGEPPKNPVPASEPPRIAAAHGPDTFYVIPGCYAGNRPPNPARLPKGCDLMKM